MTNRLLAVLGIAALASTSAHAIDAKYRKQLERSGCTQVTEAQGCDVTKTKAENARVGFGNNAGGTTGQTPYAGQWVAIGPTGGTVATIRIDQQEHVWVNGKRVNAKRSDGALVFRDGFISYTIQGDRRLKGEDTWRDSDAGSTGPINAE